VAEVDGPSGRLHYVVTGDGDHATVFVPGLAQSIADTRSFGSAVEGRRVFVDLRGHGGSAAPASDDGWSYGGLADDVRAVSEVVGATRALGVSLGAGALVRLLAGDPTRFERVVLALPGVLTGSRSNAELAVSDRLADAMTDAPGGDPSGTASALIAMQPESVRGRADVRLWARRHAAELGARRDTAAAIRLMPRATAIESLDALALVTADVLVLAQRGDDVHPLASAEQLAEAIPGAVLMVSDVPWIWGARSQLRGAVSGFLNR
jgi:pimeloyl-ACP methyl ester carboxylesterase